MFCGKMSNNIIVKPPYRTFREIYDMQTKLYEEQLKYQWPKENSQKKSSTFDGGSI